MGAGLTNIQLAKRADVPCSLIAGLQSGKRRIGELQARRIGLALGLHGTQFEEFIFEAINQCSEKVLFESRPYPAEVLNIWAKVLRGAGITPEQVRCAKLTGNEVTLALLNGAQVKLEAKLTVV